MIFLKQNETQILNPMTAQLEPIETGWNRGHIEKQFGINFPQVTKNHDNFEYDT